MKSKKIILMLIIIVGSLVFVDYKTKSIAEKNLSKFSHSENTDIYQAKKKVIIGSEFNRKSKWGIYFGWTYIRNKGTAFGALRGMSQQYRTTLFLILSLIAALVWIYILAKTSSKDMLKALSLLLLLAGGVGNGIDRIFRGYVIDFIDLRWALMSWNYKFPAFNIADIYLVIGIVMFIVSVAYKDFQANRSASN